MSFKKPEMSNLRNLRERFLKLSTELVKKDLSNLDNLVKLLELKRGLAENKSKKADTKGSERYNNSDK